MNPNTSYQRLPTNGVRSKPLASLWCLRWPILAAALSSALTWLVVWETLSRSPPDKIGLETQWQTFTYNRTYAEASEVSHRAWQALFPNQGGFFQHPRIAPERSGLSVFHQLHCLDSIRQSYWYVWDAAQADVSMDDQKMDHALRPAHVRHCIDMLRQSLMCRPDLTVELVDPAIKASKGFGTRHECQNYGQLLHFMEHWESWKGGADAFVGMGED